MGYGVSMGNHGAELVQVYAAEARFAGEAVEDVGQAVAYELSRIAPSISPGAQVAVAVGSRGIANLSLIVGATVRWLTEYGAHPFIVPAMGSHGGATAAGQKALLQSYGIGEESLGVPVHSSMDVVELDSTGLEHPLFFDRAASQADATVVINRVKPHTDFHGPHESGLLKMCVIGLGKHRQALVMHSQGVRGLRDLVTPAARKVLQEANIACGIAVAENAYDETAAVRAALPQDFESVDAELLAISRRNMPSLPTDEIDVLIVDEMGKEISGVGMDPNVIGRVRVAGEREPEKPRVTALVVCRLTPASHGNALGVGLADVTTRELFRSIDYAATRENAITSTFLERGKIPLIAETERDAYEVALRSCHLPDGTKPRVVRIRNTMHPGRALVSDAVRQELQGRGDVRVSSRPVPLSGEGGCLCDAEWDHPDGVLWSF
jgi:hypothetical protein